MGGGKRYLLKFRIILCFELLLLIFSICQYTHPLHKYLYSGQELSADCCRYQTFSNHYGLGCYLDENLISDDNADPEYLYITTPYVNLSKGSYQVSVIYATDRERNYSANSKFGTYPVTAGHEAMNLSKSKNIESFSFFSPIRVDEYQIHINYLGGGYLFVESVSIYETNTWKNIQLFYVIFFSFILNIVVLVYQRIPLESRREARFTLFVLVSLAMYTSVPFMSYFIPEGDDLFFHLKRIEAIRSSLLAGQFPNRVSTFWNHGYGYAAAVFYGEAFLYLPALLRIIGFSVQAAYKFYAITINLSTAFISYFCFKKIFRDNRVALAGCAAYMLAPYRLVCIFLRAAVGEFTAMAFLPLVLYGLFCIYKEDTTDVYYKNGWKSLVLGYSGLIQCHVLSCVMSAVFTGLFCLVFLRRTLKFKRFFQLIKAGCWTTILNLWFIWPFADYFRLGYTSATKSGNPLGRMNSNGAFLSQMITLYQRGVGPSYSVGESFTIPNERNYAVGGFLVVAFLYLCYRIYHGREKSEVSRIGDLSLAFAAVSLFMCTIWFPWDALQQMNGLLRMVTRNIQFPWRFLGITSLLLTITVICFILMLQASCESHLYHCLLIIIGFIFLLPADYFMFDCIQNASLGRYVDEQDIPFTPMEHGEYLPDGTPMDFDEDAAVMAGDNVEILSDQYILGTYEVESRNLSGQESYVDIPFLPYKGYLCRDNETGEKLEVLLNIPGKVRVILPSRYKGKFTVAYKEPWHWRIAETVSLFAVFIGTIGFVSSNKKTRSFCSEADMEHRDIFTKEEEP